MDRAAFARAAKSEVRAKPRTISATKRPGGLPWRAASRRVWVANSLPIDWSAQPATYSFEQAPITRRNDIRTSVPNCSFRAVPAPHESSERPSRPVPRDAASATRTGVQLESLARSRLDLDQPQDHVGVILARSAHGPHAVDDGSLDLDETFAPVALHGPPSR